MSRFVLTLACPDRMGIVAAVSTMLTRLRCNIVDSAQFGDVANERFFMRVCFDATAGTVQPTLEQAFESVAKEFGMQHRFHDVAVRQKMLVLVSRAGHCLNDLLYRYRTGELPVEIPAVVSNHADFEPLVASHDIPFIHLPIGDEGPERQEARLGAVIQDSHCDLVVLARYMRILSAPLCAELSGKAINIHHSFLPSFQGARPYHQAHARGVKLIGATAHYVTDELDEGPIIEQGVARVDHAMGVNDYVEVGRDVECRVLSRAVKWHLQHRVVIEDDRTIVFR